MHCYVFFVFDVFKDGPIQESTDAHAALILSNDMSCHLFQCSFKADSALSIMQVAYKLFSTAADDLCTN